MGLPRTRVSARSSAIEPHSPGRAIRSQYPAPSSPPNGSTTRTAGRPPNSSSVEGRPCGQRRWRAAARRVSAVACSSASPGGPLPSASAADVATAEKRQSPSAGTSCRASRVPSVASRVWRWTAARTRSARGIRSRALLTLDISRIARQVVGVTQKSPNAVG